MLISSRRQRRAQLILYQLPILVTTVLHPIRSHGRCLASATGGLLLCGRYLLVPLTWNKEGSKGKLWFAELRLHQLGSLSIVDIPRWTTHPCILYRDCAAHGLEGLNNWNEINFFRSKYSNGSRQTRYWITGEPGALTVLSLFIHTGEYNVWSRRTKSF